jgi:hypothetical protein
MGCGYADKLPRIFKGPQECHFLTFSDGFIAAQAGLTTGKTGIPAFLSDRIATKKRVRRNGRAFPKGE